MIVWFIMILISIFTCILAIYSTVKDQAALGKVGDINHKFMVVKWCFNRHALMLGSQLIILFAVIHIMETSITLPVVPLVVALILREVILITKIMYDMWMKSKILSDL